MKNKLRYTIVMIVIVSCFGGIIVITGNEKKSHQGFNFTNDIAFYINTEESVSMGEYLLYAASITQNVEKTYGMDVWTEMVTLKNGTKISYEELTKRQIVEQIRMTKLLCQKADEYGISLTDKEQKSISSDAESYLDSINKYNVSEKGIDLTTVLRVYQDNALAEKVHNHIISLVINNKENYFEKVYTQMGKESSPNWSYEKYANQIVLSELNLSNHPE